MANFQQIPIMNIEGKKEYIDIRKPLGNALYYQSQDIAGAELGRKIYLSTADLTVTDEEQKLIIAMASNIFPYVTRHALEEYLKDNNSLPHK